MSGPPLSFGPFILDPDRRSLARNGGAMVELGQRGCALLLALLRAGGEAVSKTALLDQVWPDTAVEEGNLTVQIAQLRKLMGQDAEGRDWIVTVPRVGYRLPNLQGPAAEAGETPRPALAVLPFVNLSGDLTQDYFTDGVVEDLITALSKFKSFAVISRSSSFAYKGQAVDVRQVGRDLGVRYVLEGSFRRAGDRLRISAQLVECANGQHLWAEHFNGAVAEVFDFQDRITENVVALVEPNILRAEILRARRSRPESLDAYDLYLQALPDVFVSRPDANARAIALLERVIALDPSFAQATAFAAQAYLLRIVMQFEGAGPADVARAIELARAALDLTHDDATVLGYGGFVLLQIAREYDAGLAVLRRALQENPNNIEVLNLAGIGELMGGDLTLGAQCLERALRLDPNGFGTHWQMTGMAHIRMAEGRYEAALDWAMRSLAINPHYDPTHWMLIAANAYLGRQEEARRHVAGYLAIAPHASLSRIKQGQHPRDPHRIDVLIDGMRLAGLQES
jgi:adenylate cyclase